MTKSEALKILEDLSNSPNMVKHAISCGFVMRDLCIKFQKEKHDTSEPFDEEDWEIVGLLHDADYEKTNKSLDDHTEETTKILKERAVNMQVIDAIRGHCDKAPRKTLMSKAIYAADELTGLIVACALVMPDKKLKSLTVESVLKKFKDPSFARGANREQIKTCESMLDISLEQFVSTVLTSMQKNSRQLGL